MAESAAHALGAAGLLRAGNRSRARILMYHRFPGPPDRVREQLTIQCEHLRRHYQPIGLSELAEAVRERRPLPSNALAITVDDGYADFSLAFPVFRAFGLKVTLYVVSGFASQDIWLWPDRLQYLLEATERKALRVPVPRGQRVEVDVSTPGGRRAAFDALCEALIASSDSERLRALAELPSVFGAEIPNRLPPRFAPLSWEELRAMAADGLEVGCHTSTHPIVSKLETPAALDAEIAGAKQIMEARLGFPVRHFCYPNGTSRDFNDAAVSAVQRAGFETAVTTESGLAGVDSDLFRLPRLGVEPGNPRLYFERCVAGYRR